MSILMLLFSAASDVFSHSLDLSLRDKIVFTVCAPLLVPFRILSAILLAFLIWSSSRLGLLFTNPEVRRNIFFLIYMRSKVPLQINQITMPLNIIVS